MSEQKASLRPPHLSPTPRQVEGPFFLLDSPRHSPLTPKGVRGILHRLSGQVISTDGTIVPNPTIHIWLADPNGVYDNQDAHGNPLDLPPSQHHYRGRVTAETLLLSNSYSFTFLRPGNYPIPEEGLEARPAHVHALVEAEGYSELITQLYFQDDPYNQLDIKRPGFFKSELVAHYLPVTTLVFADTQVSIFNFVMRKMLPKPNYKAAREQSIAKILATIIIRSACEFGTLPQNMKDIAQAYEDAAYLGIGMDRLTQMVNQKLSPGRMRIRLQSKKITGRDTSLRSGHWRFHRAEFVVTVKHTQRQPEPESALLKFSTLEAL